MKNVSLLTLGCKLNYAESSTYERLLRARGWNVVSPGAQTDLFVVNTCSVTAVSDAKSRNLIRKVHRMNPEARIFVTGCSAQLRRDEIEGIEGVTAVFGCSQKSFLVPAAECADQLEEISVALCSGARVESPEALCSGARVESPEALCSGAPADPVFAAYSTGERTRSFLKVQDGCDNFCRYCTVPYARGRSRNVPISECVGNARLIAAQGVREIVLTGVNTGDFGKSTGESFLDLLKALDKVDGISRYRISSIEPNLLTDEIIAWIASGSTKFQPHFHIPLQAGSDALLQAMGRKYTTEFFRDKIHNIRSLMGERVFFGIDVIAGLPGETPELFEEGLRFLGEDIRPAYIHVFPYSARPGTPAAAMDGQVGAGRKKERVARLEELCASLNASFVASRKGTKEQVLWESREKDGMMGGYTGNYIRVRRPYDPSRVGTIETVEI